TFRMFIAKIECRVLFAAHEGGAVLELEACLYHRPQHASLFEVFHALRQQAFADAKARKLFTLEHQHLPALLTQQSSRYRASRPGANDQNFHRLSIFPFQTIQHHRATPHRSWFCSISTWVCWIIPKTRNYEPHRDCSD